MKTGLLWKLSVLKGLEEIWAFWGENRAMSVRIGHFGENWAV